MASGKLGSASLVANVNTLVYIVPPTSTATINIAVVNRGEVPSMIDILISSGSPQDSDYIEFNTIIPPCGILERTAIVVGAGENVVLKSSTGECSVRVHGFEE